MSCLNPRRSVSTVRHLIPMEARLVAQPCNRELSNRAFAKALHFALRSALRRASTLPSPPPQVLLPPRESGTATRSPVMPHLGEHSTASPPGSQPAAGTSQTSHERLKEKGTTRALGLEGSLGRAHLLLFQRPHVAKLCIFCLLASKWRANSLQRKQVSSAGCKQKMHVVIPGLRTALE